MSQGVMEVNLYEIFKGVFAQFFVVYNNGQVQIPQFENEKLLQEMNKLLTS